ncbi:peptide ABC transporter substrate-binding protein [Necropsobacter massiliensis]|uniref:peptide ABC transporter substrate-binding protein n=1 Tax=Necropsobacter massiliensis TaxID=1400001 RepID=UPI0005959CBC|nr:peptide ABC transporter substrate-binding protein [Necropsobacter massiliensis]
MFNFPLSLHSLFSLKSAVFFCAVLGLSACDQPVQPSESSALPPVSAPQVNVEVLTRGVYGDLVISPSALQNEEQSIFLRDILEGLVIYDPHGRIIPAVAESWRTEDNKNWTFVLRDDAKWSNGEPVTASDFVRSWQLLARSDSPLKSYLTFLNLQHAPEVIAGELPVEKLGVDAIGERELRIRLDKAKPYLPAMLVHPVLLPQYLNAHSGFVTNGAYTVAGQQNDMIHLVKNPYYRAAEQGFFKQVDYRKITPQQGLNELDLVHNPASSHSAISYLPTLCSYYYEFNFKDPILAKSAVRKALVSMMSARNLVRHELPAMQASSHLLPQSMRMEQESRWEPVLVEQLLQQNGINEKTPLQLHLTFDQDGIHPRVAQGLMQMLSQSDMIRISAEPVSWQQLLEKRATGDFQIIRSGWCADYHEPSAFLMNFYSAGPDNKSGYSNKKVDQLLEQTLQNISEQERSALYAQVIDILQQDNVVLPVFQYTAAVYIDPSLDGIDRLNPTQTIYSKDLFRRRIEPHE